MASDDPESASLRGLVEAARLVHYRVSPDGLLQTANAMLAKVLGIDPTALHPGTRVSSGAPCLTQPWDEFRRLVVAAGTVTSRNSVWTRADGTTFEVRESARALHDANGVLVGIEGLAEDVSAERALERERAQLQWAYSRVVDNLPDALIRDDVSGRVVFANRAFLELFGLEERDLPTLMLESYVAPEYRAMLRDRHDRRVRGESVSDRFEYVGLRKDGTRLDLEVSVVQVVEFGVLVGTQSVIRNVTERKRMEREIYKSGEILHKLIGALPMAVTGLDAERRVTLWNPSAERMFGWKEAEVLGRPYPLVSTEAERTEHQRIWDAAMGGRTLAGFETQRRAKDGHLVDVAIWAAPLRDADGCLVSSIGVLADITQMKQAERELKLLNETLERRVEERTQAAVKAQEQLRHAQKMDAIGRLAGGIAHDFNNLLMGIQGFGELGQRQLPAGHPARHGLEEIAKAAQRGTSLVRQLLTFGRQEVVSPRLLQLNAQLADLRNLLLRLIRADIELDWRPGPSVPPLLIDPTQLEQVVVNLVVNAGDAMPEGGRLTIATGSEPPPPGSDRPWVTLEISDTGTGMTDEVRSHLFEPFFTTKPRGKGSGLGLATTYGIVEQNHGRIEVHSQPGEGTRFLIRFPAADEDPVRREPSPAPDTVAHGGGPERVLLVEDEELVRELTRTALESVGYEVFEAANGAEALSLIEGSAQGVDIVITDMVMPGMGGWEMAQQLRRKRPGLPILYMSGYLEDEIIRRNVKENGLPFLQKPFDLESLFRAVRGLLAKA